MQMSSKNVGENVRKTEESSGKSNLQNRTQHLSCEYHLFFFSCCVGNMNYSPFYMCNKSASNVGIQRLKS